MTSSSTPGVQLNPPGEPPIGIIPPAPAVPPFPLAVPLPVVPATPVIPPAPLFVPAAPLFVPAAPLFAPDPVLPFPAAPEFVELPEVLQASVAQARKREREGPHCRHCHFAFVFPRLCHFTSALPASP